MAGSVVASRSLISAAAGVRSCSSASPSFASLAGKAVVRPSFVGLKLISPRKTKNCCSVVQLEFGGRSSRVSTRAFSMPTTIEASSSIQVGQKLPEAELSYLDSDNNVQTVKISELTDGKKVVLFAVPGAFTPTCSQKHVPGFVEKSDELKAKGIDTIACVSVNDVFVLKAWGESLGVGDKVLLLSDGNLLFTKAMGVQLDLSDKPVGLGIRSRRYALLADNGVVKQLNIEEGGAFSVSGADEILKAL